MSARALLLAAVCALGACTAQDLSHYSDQRPQLDLGRFFAGTSDAWGVFEKRNGEVVRRFHVLIEGREEGDTLVLDEHFEYSDGTRQQRTWTLRRGASGHWSGTAADVVGVADGGVAGNTLHWGYVLRLPVGDRSYDVTFDDWMYLLDESTLVSLAHMSKFGVRLGRVTLLFRKRGAPP